MKRMSLNDIVGYGSRVFVYCEKDGRDSDETKIEIDFSKSSFPDITIEALDGKIRINANGSIEQNEILEAFRSVVKMLES
jgi:hypothetical protein